MVGRLQLELGDKMSSACQLPYLRRDWLSMLLTRIASTRARRQMSFQPYTASASTRIPLVGEERGEIADYCISKQRALLSVRLPIEQTKSPSSWSLSSTIYIVPLALK